MKQTDKTDNFGSNDKRFSTLDDRKQLRRTQ